MPEWPGTKTFIADEIVDEDDLNTYISDAQQHLYDKINDLSSGVPGVNFFKNYPSLEMANGAQPEWWEVSGDPTLTEEDATGESIPQKHERVLKLVVSADGGDSDYVYQRLTHTDEPLLDESVSKLSVGMWVYTPTAGTVTLELYDNGGTTSLGSDTTTEVDTWVWLEILNKTIGTTSTDIRLKHSANDAIIYAAQPMANIGAVVNTWQLRGLIYKEDPSNNMANTTGDTNWRDLDCTTHTSNMAVIGVFGARMSSAGNSLGLAIRRNGSSISADSYPMCVSYAVTGGQAMCLMDDGQVIEYAQTHALSYTTFQFRILGYYEWES